MKLIEWLQFIKKQNKYWSEMTQNNQCEAERELFFEPLKVNAPNILEEKRKREEKFGKDCL